MTFQTHIEIAKGRVDPAPMVDIVFLLLIFLVLSSPFVLQPGYGLVELPTGAGDVATLQELVLSVSRDNVMHFDALPTTLEKLPEQLRRAALNSRNASLVVKIDRQVSYETITKIFAIAFEAGITTVNLATRPAVPVAPAK
jgi:biopolymer transport protein ExbD